MKANFYKLKVLHRINFLSPTPCNPPSPLAAPAPSRMPHPPSIHLQLPKNSGQTFHSQLSQLSLLLLEITSAENSHVKNIAACNTIFISVQGATRKFSPFSCVYIFPPRKTCLLHLPAPISQNSVVSLPISPSSPSSLSSL